MLVNNYSFNVISEKDINTAISVFDQIVYIWNFLRENCKRYKDFDEGIDFFAIENKINAKYFVIEVSTKNRDQKELIFIPFEVVVNPFYYLVDFINHLQTESDTNISLEERVIFLTNIKIYKKPE